MIGAMVSGLAAAGIIVAATLYRSDDAAGVAVPLVLAAGRARPPTPTVMSAYAFG